MITRDKLLRTPEYWFELAQNELFRQVTAFMDKEGINQTQLAQRLGVSKGYISQILKGDFNYTLKKLIEISIAIGKMPIITYKPMKEKEKSVKRTYHVRLSKRNGRQTNHLNANANS